MIVKVETGCLSAYTVDRDRRTIRHFEQDVVKVGLPALGIKSPTARIG